MNITLMAFGSRGDIQPFLALAVALRERGNTVTLAAPSDYEPQITSYGVSYVNIPINNMDVIQRDATRQATSSRSPATLLAFLREVIPELKRAFLSAAHNVADAAQNSDLLIAHGFLIPFAYSIHQHLQIPLMLGIAAPIVPTKTFPSPAFPPRRFGKRIYIPLTYQLLLRGVLTMMIGPMNAYRRSVALPTLSAGKVIGLLSSGQFPVVMHYSLHLWPAAPDWSANVHVVGAWPLAAPHDWTPPDSLQKFLAQGEAPVFIGFGSMPLHKPTQMAKTVAEALRLANLRGVLQAGWGGLAHEDEHLITIGDTPHEWLFPRMAAFVHHGGSGTTHSALSAGKPSLIVPFMADQPFWGRRLAELGAGVSPIKPKRLTSESLALALRTLTQDAAMRRRAAELGEQLRADDGLAATCNLVQEYVR